MNILSINLFKQKETFLFFVCSPDGFGPNSKVTIFKKTVFSLYFTVVGDLNKANTTCNNYGGFVAHIKTKEIQDFILKQFEDDITN